MSPLMRAASTKDLPAGLKSASRPAGLGAKATRAASMSIASLLLRIRGVKRVFAPSTGLRAPAVARVTLPSWLVTTSSSASEAGPMFSQGR